MTRDVPGAEEHVVRPIRSARRFLVCLHDVTPAYARETSVMMRDLAPLVGRRSSFAVVPNWHNDWPLTSHRDYCGMVKEACEEVLLHGYVHQRQRGWGPATLLTDGSDEMNGLDFEETRRTIDRGQRVLTEVFGESARGFLAPGWQLGRVRGLHATELGLEYVLGYFSLESAAGRRIPLTTWSWDNGRWGWLGHIGQGIGTLLQPFDRVPVVAIHPRDVGRGFWPVILRVIRDLLDAAYQPATPSQLLCSSHGLCVVSEPSRC